LCTIHIVATTRPDAKQFTAACAQLGRQAKAELQQIGSSYDAKGGGAKLRVVWWSIEPRNIWEVESQQGTDNKPANLPTNHATSFLPRKRRKYYSLGKGGNRSGFRSSSREQLLCKRVLETIGCTFNYRQIIEVFIKFCKTVVKKFKCQIFIYCEIHI
jgi:hypothetical protein